MHEGVQQWDINSARLVKSLFSNQLFWSQSCVVVLFTVLHTAYKDLTDLLPGISPQVLILLHISTTTSCFPVVLRE